MFINAVLSSNGAWKKLISNYKKEFEEIKSAVSYLNEQSMLRSGATALHHYLHSELNRKLTDSGWQTNIRLSLGSGHKTRFKVDFLKNRIGGKLVIGKQAFLLSALLANFPLAVKVHSMDIAFTLVPMNTLSQHLDKGVAHFEFIRELLNEIPPLTIRYPFLILGFSSDSTITEPTELTTELDQFLIKILHLTMDEMLVLGEKPNYDFKLMPPHSDKIAKEVCGLSNIRGGGILLFGISDKGAVKGLPRVEMDAIQLAITSAIRGSCMPIPPFDLHTFDIPGKPSRMILVVHVHELKNKPCMTRDRVYVRSGPSAQPATPEEIRRMILG